MADRSLLMAQRLAPDDMTGRYNTALEPGQEFAYSQWLQQQSALAGRDMSRDNFDYDTRGAYAGGAAQSGNSHWPDTYKKPNHPTFSDESIYHGVNGNFGGQWINAPGQSFYQASPQNLRMHGAEKLKHYFSQVEPDIQLLIPPGGRTTIGEMMMPRGGN